MDEKYDVVASILKYPYFKKAGVVIFANIINIVTMFIKTIRKDSRKVERIRNYLSSSNLYVYFLM